MTPTFEITNYGIPSEHDNIENRNYIMIPLENNTSFKKLLKKIDKSIITNASTIFGDDVDISTKTQISLVKLPNEKYGDKPQFFKSKFDVDYNSQNILTRIFFKGKPVETKNIDDVAKYITLGSTIQMVILIEKVWADNGVFENTNDDKFGIILKTLQINVVKQKEKFQNSNTFGKTI